MKGIWLDQGFTPTENNISTHSLPERELGDGQQGMCVIRICFWLFEAHGNLQRKYSDRSDCRDSDKPHTCVVPCQVCFPTSFDIIEPPRFGRVKSEHNQAIGSVLVTESQLPRTASWRAHIARGQLRYSRIIWGDTTERLRSRQGDECSEYTQNEKVVICKVCTKASNTVE